MAGAPIPPTDITYDTFPINPSLGCKTDSFSVQYVHGGGSTSTTDRTQDPFAIYLRARLERFGMREIRMTHAFEQAIEQHAEEIRALKPDILIGRSQGGPTILELVKRGHWNGPIMLCCPAMVDGIDEHIMDLPRGFPVIVVAGVVDEQVNIHTLKRFYKRNKDRLQGGLKFVSVKDIHCLQSLLNDEVPAPVVETSVLEPSAMLVSGNGQKVTLMDLLQELWDMRDKALPSDPPVVKTAFVGNDSTSAKRGRCLCM